MIHTSAKLCYRLLDGPACLEPLRVLASRQAAWRGWRVTCMVLGASHAVRLERDGRQLTELLSCAPPEGPMRALVESSELTGEFCATAHGVRCQARFESFALEAGDDLRGPFPASERLDVAFPAAGGPTPYTRIGWRIEAGCLCIETIHTYPEEGRGIRSETAFAAMRAK